MTPVPVSAIASRKIRSASTRSTSCPSVETYDAGSSRPATSASWSSAAGRWAPVFGTSQVKSAGTEVRSVRKPASAGHEQLAEVAVEVGQAALEREGLDALLGVPLEHDPRVGARVGRLARARRRAAACRRRRTGGAPAPPDRPSLQRSRARMTPVWPAGPTAAALGDRRLGRPCGSSAPSSAATATSRRCSRWPGPRAPPGTRWRWPARAGWSPGSRTQGSGRTRRARSRTTPAAPAGRDLTPARGHRCAGHGAGVRRELRRPGRAADGRRRARPCSRTSGPTSCCATRPTWARRSRPSCSGSRSPPTSCSRRACWCDPSWSARCSTSYAPSTGWLPTPAWPG